MAEAVLIALSVFVEGHLVVSEDVTVICEIRQDLTERKV